MSLQISSSAISKLGHDIPEIRSRALKHIDGKIQRSLDLNEDIVFNPGSLLKHLIRWFGQQPLQDEENVLNLIVKILQSKYIDEAVQYLTKERLLKEFNKIEKIVQSTFLKKKVSEMIDLIERHRSPEGRCSLERSECKSLSSSSITYTSSSDILLDDTSDYETQWTVPSVPDYNSLKLLSETLSTGSEDGLQHAFNYLEAAITDYPPEYFLQPPYIFNSLLLLSKKRSFESEVLLKILTSLTRSLTGRIKKRQLSKTYFSSEDNKLHSANNQITTQRYCIVLFNLCLEYYKTSSELENKPPPITIYNLQKEILDVIANDLHFYDFRNTVLIDLGNLARYFRQRYSSTESETALNRMLYIYILQIIIEVLDIEAKKNIQLIPTAGKSKARYDPETYMSNSSYHDIHHLDSWMVELECALFDFSLKEMYGALYKKIKIYCKATEKNKLQILLNCENVLNPAVEVMKNHGRMPSEKLVIEGSKVIDTLLITKNIDFVTKLVDAIVDCVPLYDGNDKLKDCAETMLLKLLSHDDVNIRRTMYKECCNKAKHFFAEAMNGEVVVSGRSIGGAHRIPNFGIPVTASILNQIICQGYCDEDVIIQTNAETILVLILKSKPILGSNWKEILDILLPNLTLLQSSVANEKSSLSALLLKLYDPDDSGSDIDLLESIKGNLRFLFSRDEEIRRDGLSRIIYLVSTQPEAEIWTPNILQISDTILNDVCILNTPRNSEKIFTSGLYEKNTVRALLELLNSPDVEPSIRKTTLLQLNVMSQDPDLAEFIHNEHGWSLVLQAIENALKKTGSIDYPDAAIPAVGIIAKISLCVPEFRRELSKELNIYFLILRALFSYPYEDAFKQDCILLIFLLTFSTILIGSKRISIPEMCKGLQMPIFCQTISQENRHPDKSPLEQAYAELFADIIDSPRSNSSSEFQFTTNHSNDSISSLKQCALRFMRIQLAILWCDGLENVLNEVTNMEGNQNYPKFRSRNQIINYGDNISSLKEFLKYNAVLNLRKTDIESVKISSRHESIKQFLYDASNATTHCHVAESIAKIHLCITVASKISSHQQKHILNTFKRFIMTPPNNAKDVALFENVLNLLAHLISAGNDDALFLIISELKIKHCLFWFILKNLTSSIWLYKATCKFLQLIVKQCIYHTDQNQLKSHLKSNKNEDDSNFYNQIFERILKISEEAFRLHDIDRFRLLLSLAQYISLSNSIDLDEGFSINIAKQMLDFIMKLKSFTQTGSHINKNALLIARNVLENISEIILDGKYLKCLSGLCAHQDFEIRALSWCVLEKISRSLKGAHSLIKALSYLPGGFHACCLSTFLDFQETPIVRATAGGLLSNFLTYTKETPTGKILNMTVAPLCSNLPTSTANDGVQLLLQLFNKHRFYNRVEISLDYFYIADIILINEKDCIATCDIVRMYCSVFINFAELYPEILSLYLEFACFEKIFQIIKNVPLCITESSLNMLAEICNLLTKFLQADESLMLSLMSRDRCFIEILVNTLDWRLFENSIKSAPIHIMQVLRILAKEMVPYNMILNSISADVTGKFFTFICFATNCNDILLSRSCVEFVGVLLIKGQTGHFDFPTFHEILDTTEVLDGANLKINNKAIESKRNSTKAKYASELLLIVLFKLFASFDTSEKSKHSCEKQKLLSACSETLSVLLKHSKQARNIASRIQLFDYLLTKLQNIFDKMGMNCTDFIRKYGDVKKQPVIDSFISIFTILLNWYLEDTLADEKQILGLTKILLNTWPWINHSVDLRITFVKLLAFVSENSIAVCKQFSSMIAGQTSTILQQLISLLVQETLKVKSSQIDATLLEIGLRAMSNCCSCIEGRLQSLKFNALDVFNKFHPSVTKSQKCWNPIILLWLKYWEIFSRYPEGATVRHMHLLCILITKSTKNIRYQCLTILRNMAFLNSNRAALCSSEDFLYISKSILCDGSRSEQILVLVAVWRLIAGNCKAKHAIKSTSIPKKIKMMHDEMIKSCYEVENDNLMNVLEILSKILE